MFYVQRLRLQRNIKKSNFSESQFPHLWNAYGYNIYLKKHYEGGMCKRPVSGMVEILNSNFSAAGVAFVAFRELNLSSGNWHSSDN